MKKGNAANTSKTEGISLKNIVQRFREGYANLQMKKQMAGAPQAGTPIPMQMPRMKRPFGPVEITGEIVTKTEKAKKKIEEGIEIPGKEYVEVAGEGLRKRISYTGLNVFYNLIPRFPKRGEDIFAYANIAWNPNEAAVLYNVIEPPLTDADKEIIAQIKKDLEEKLDVDFYKIGEEMAKKILKEETEKLFMSLEPALDRNKLKSIIYYIERDIIGFGKIEPLMNDPNIEDISCDGVGVGLYVYHRDPRLGSLKTNIKFDTKEELDNFVVRLSQKCKKAISIAEPLLDASLPDGSRVQITLGTDIARKGSNFTIRKFTSTPLTPTHILKLGTVNSTELAYLWLAIENRQSMLISGGSATGKTSMLNALSLFIRPSMKIVSIEDTAELRIPLPHWVPHVSRTPIAVQGERGEVSLFDLLKASLRQRPDYIIVGEVRGKEAFVLFQQIATGHAGLATIHAASFPQLVDRLTTPPISLPSTLLENINIIIFLVLSRLAGKSVRRADRIVEIVGVEEQKLLTNDIFKWNPSSDDFQATEKSVILKNLSERLGMKPEDVQNELVVRKKVLEWMLKKNIFDYKEVAKVIEAYYSNPEKVIKMAGV